MPDDSLLEMARQAMEKARLFGSGLGEDLGAQLGQTPDKLKDLIAQPEPGSMEAMMPPQAMAGMKLLGLLPSLDQGISSGLGRAGMAGGQEAGFYKPDSPLGEISLGPRELIGMGVGMVIPTGKFTKAAQIEKLAAGNLSKAMQKAGPGAQRLALRSLERKAAQEAAHQNEIIQPVLSQTPTGRGMSRAQVNQRFADEVPAAESEMEQGWKKFQGAYDEESGAATPQPGQMRLGQGMAKQARDEDNMPEEFKNWGKGGDEVKPDTELPGRVPTTEEMKRELADLRYRAGIQKTEAYVPEDRAQLGLFLDEEGPQLPAGMTPLELSASDIADQARKKPSEQRLLKRAGDRRSAYRETEARFAPSLYDDMSDAELLSEIEEMEKAIGKTWKGNQKPTGLEARRVQERWRPQIQRYIDEELKKAGGDVWKTQAVKERLYNAGHRMEPRTNDYGDPLYKLDEAGEPLIDPKTGRKTLDNPYEAYFKRVERYLRDETNDELAKRREFNPNARRRLAGYKPWQHEIKLPDTTKPGWQNTPEGEAFLEAEVKRFLTKDVDPDEWAHNTLSNKGHDFALMSDPENPEVGQRWKLSKNRREDTVELDEGQTAEDWDEYVGRGGPMGADSIHGMTKGELQGAGMSEFDPHQTATQREVDKISRDTARNPLAFDDDETAKEFYMLRTERDRTEQLIDRMGGFSDQELLDLKTTPAAWKKRHTQLQKQLDEQNARLSEMLGIDDIRAYEAGELPAGDRPQRMLDLGDDYEPNLPNDPAKARALRNKVQLIRNRGGTSDWMSPAELRVAEELAEDDKVRALRGHAEGKSRLENPNPQPDVPFEGTPDERAAARAGRTTPPGGTGYESPFAGKPGEKAASQMLAQSMEDIKRILSEVRSGSFVNQAERGRWEDYMEARLREMGVPRAPTPLNELLKR